MDDTNRQFWKIAAVSLLVLLLPAFFFGGKALWASHLRHQEQQAEAAERRQVNAYGVPALMGPLESDGPTFGSGAHADLDTTDNGWRWQEGSSERYVFISVHNKSASAWQNVQARLNITDRHGRFLRVEPCDFGRLAPGQTLDRTFGPVEPQDYAFEITGYTGRRSAAP